MRGDEHDFEDFYAAVFDQLVGQLFLATGNLQDAEDAVQEALTRAAVRWPRPRRHSVAGLVIALVGDRLVGFDAATGARRRQTPVGSVATRNRLVALDRASGREAWSSARLRLATAPVVTADRVVAATGDGTLVGFGR